MPPLPADSIHARACKLKCEKILTRPTHVTPDMQRAASDVVGGFLKNLLGEELNSWQGNEKAEPAP